MASRLYIAVGPSRPVAPKPKPPARWERWLGVELARQLKQGWHRRKEERQRGALEILAREEGWNPQESDRAVDILRNAVKNREVMERAVTLIIEKAVPTPKVVSILVSYAGTHFNEKATRASTKAKELYGDLPEKEQQTCLEKLQRGMLKHPDSFKSPITAHYVEAVAQFFAFVGESTPSGEETQRRLAIPCAKAMTYFMEVVEKNDPRRQHYPRTVLACMHALWEMGYWGDGAFWERRLGDPIGRGYAVDLLLGMKPSEKGDNAGWDLLKKKDPLKNEENLRKVSPLIAGITTPTKIAFLKWLLDDEDNVIAAMRIVKQSRMVPEEVWHKVAEKLRAENREVWETAAEVLLIRRRHDLVAEDLAGLVGKAEDRLRQSFRQSLLNALKEGQFEPVLTPEQWEDVAWEIANLASLEGKEGALERKVLIALTKEGKPGTAAAVEKTIDHLVSRLYNIRARSEAMDGVLELMEIREAEVTAILKQHGYPRKAIQRFKEIRAAQRIARERVQKAVAMQMRMRQMAVAVMEEAAARPVVVEEAPSAEYTEMLGRLRRTLEEMYAKVDMVAIDAPLIGLIETLSVKEVLERVAEKTSAEDWSKVMQALAEAAREGNGIGASARKALVKLASEYTPSARLLEMEKSERDGEKERAATVRKNIGLAHDAANLRLLAIIDQCSADLERGDELQFVAVHILIDLYKAGRTELEGKMGEIRGEMNELVADAEAAKKDSEAGSGKQTEGGAKGAEPKEAADGEAGEADEDAKKEEAERNERIAQNAAEAKAVLKRLDILARDRASAAGEITPTNK